MRSVKPVDVTIADCFLVRLTAEFRLDGFDWVRFWSGSFFKNGEMYLSFLTVLQTLYARLLLAPAKLDGP